MNANPRTGGHILIEQLALHNADTVFGVPGESFLAALDGMYQSQRVRFINARHEGGAERSEKVAPCERLAIGERQS